MQGSHAEDAAVAILFEQLDVIEQNIPGTLAGADPEALHDLRVAVRRSRTILKGLHGVFDPASARRFREDFRWLQQLTNPTRDLDVLLAELNDGLGDVPDLAPARQLLQSRRTAERATLRRGLTSARATALFSDWREYLRGLRGQDHGARPDAALPIKKVAGRRIGKRYRKIVKLGRSALRDPQPDAFHELRKRAKDLRYFLEFFADRFPRRAVKPLRSDLKRLHAVLGGFHDRSVQEQLLRETADELLAAGTNAAALLAIGAQLQRMESDQARADEEFRKCFKSFASKKRRALVKMNFG